LSWREELRAANHLPRTIDDGVVFCNFNKQDKLEPDVFLLWMSVLQRVPKSVLWLLQPSKGPASNLTVENLRKEAEAHGIPGERLVFAGRVEKPHHLARHAAADLFLDTLYYGAHSTASDAVRGGLPVLTLPGDAFPRRVGLSLLNNLASTTFSSGLIVTSMKDYEDVAVYLALPGHGSEILAGITEELRYIVWPVDSGTQQPPLPPLFNTKNLALDMERAFKVMWEVHATLTPQSTSSSHDGNRSPTSNHPYQIVLGPWQQSLS